jgi:hypothetical protein
VDSAERLAGELTPQERRQVLLAEYQEVCKTHAGITDFRAKLLALLPIASGAGVGLLVTQGKGDISTTLAGLLIALGAFGAVVTVGLFFYELRQIDICKQLRNHAAWIENQLGIQAGQFGGRRGRLSLRDVYSPRAHRERDKNLAAAESSGQKQETVAQRGLIPRPSSVPRRRGTSCTTRSWRLGSHSSDSGSSSSCDI